MTIVLQETYKDIVEFMSSDDVFEIYNSDEIQWFTGSESVIDRTFHLTAQNDVGLFRVDSKPAVAVSLRYRRNFNIREEYIYHGEVEIPELFKRMLKSSFIDQIKSDLNIDDVNFSLKLIGSDRMLVGYNELMVLFELGEIDPGKIDPDTQLAKFTALSNKLH